MKRTWVVCVCVNDSQRLHGIRIVPGMYLCKEHDSQK